MNSPVLTVRSLKKIYSGKNENPSVDSISFDLIEGEILGILGPNGSGKTTTIQMLLGTLSRTSGDVSYFGLDFKRHRSKILKFVSFASAYNSLPWLLSIKQNLDVFGRLYGLSAKESRKRYLPLLNRFGIHNMLQHPISSLSSGQVTRLMLVKAFFIKPKVVLLDEPTASLDPDVAKDVCDFILEQRAAAQISILFTSHNMDEVAKLCDRAIFLKEGKIISNDIPKKLAQSISSFRIKMNAADDLEGIINSAKKLNMFYKIDKNSIQVITEEHMIPYFLNSLGVDGISYTNIRIDEPTLEDYFMEIVRKEG